MFKRTIGMTTAAILSVTMAGVMPAAAEESTENIMEYSTFDEYVEYIVPRHLKAQSITIDGMLDYSNPVALYDFAENEIIGSMVFFMYDGEFVGELEVYGDNGEYLSSFSTYITEDIVNAYQNKTLIAMGYVGDSLLMYSDFDGYVYVNGVFNYDAPDTTPSNLACIEMAGISDANYIVSLSVGSVMLNGISHVGNSSTYNNGECWAAAVAMKLNYQLGLNLTADKIYEDLQEADLEPRALNAYKHYGYDAVIQSGSLSTNDAFFILRDDDKPIIMILKRTGATTNHAVVLYGVLIDNASCSIYTIDDPNCKTQTFTVNTKPNEKNDSIQYKSPTNGLYSQWLSTRY